MTIVQLYYKNRENGHFFSSHGFFRQKSVMVYQIG